MDQILHRLPITLAHAIPTNQRETLLGREFGVFRPQRYSYQLSMHINQGASLLEMIPTPNIMLKPYQVPSPPRNTQIEEHGSIPP